MMNSEGTTIYLCADATLTYGPYGGREKLIPQALPVCRVRDPKEAERIIAFVGSMDYGTPDPYGGKEIPPGYGPRIRHRYSLENYRRGDWTLLTEVGETLETIRDALRHGDDDAFHRAFEESRKGLGLRAEAVYDEMKRAFDGS